MPYHYRVTVPPDGECVLEIDAEWNQPGYVLMVDGLFACAGLNDWLEARGHPALRGRLVTPNDAHHLLLGIDALDARLIAGDPPGDASPMQRGRA